MIFLGQAVVARLQIESSKGRPDGTDWRRSGSETRELTATGAPSMTFFRLAPGLRHDCPCACSTTWSFFWGLLALGDPRKVRILSDVVDRLTFVRGFEEGALAERDLCDDGRT